MTIENRVLSAAEAEKFLGMSKVTLIRMRKMDDCGGLPFVQMSPGRVGYLLSDIMKFLDARTVRQHVAVLLDPAARGAAEEAQEAA